MKAQQDMGGIFREFNSRSGDLVETMSQNSNFGGKRTDAEVSEISKGFYGIPERNLSKTQFFDKMILTLKFLLKSKDFDEFGKIVLYINFLSQIQPKLNFERFYR